MALLVLTVPMRNGNFYSILDNINDLLVLTVPMRNGNLRIRIQLSKRVLQFLPYL